MASTSNSEFHKKIQAHKGLLPLKSCVSMCVRLTSTSWPCISVALEAAGLGNMVVEPVELGMVDVDSRGGRRVVGR